MKKLIVSVNIVILSFASYAQSSIILEKSYKGTGFITVTEIAPGSYKYVLYGFTGTDSGYTALNKISLYNMDHSVYKTINIPIKNHDANLICVNAVTETMFNRDASLEYMLVEKDRSKEYPTLSIYTEDGSVVKSISNIIPTENIDFEDIDIPYILGTKGFVQFYYLNTGLNPFKMVLNRVFSSEELSSEVYYLDGTFIQASLIKNDESIHEMLSAPIPNPSSGSTRIEYKLPEGIQKAELVIYDMYGKEYKRLLVDGAFSDIILDNESLPQGTYLYHLIINNNISETKKMIKVN